MDFKQKLSNYSQLICKYGLNIQDDQLLHLRTEAVNSDLAIMIAQEAYQLGAKYVNLMIMDPRNTRIRVESSKEQHLEYVPPYLNEMYDEYIDNQAASCSLIGSFNPDELEGLDPKKVNTIRMANYKAFKDFRDKGIEQGMIQWSIVAASTPGWAKKVFPDLSPEEGTEKLWDQIFKICRVDQENFLELWENHDHCLKSRASRLNDLKIKELHFQGPGTELSVGLTELALFQGGRSMSTRDVAFEPNIPTEECFTTPDFRKTNGKVTATRSFRVSGTLVQGLVMEFKDGILVNTSADTGLEAFKTYYQSDPGAARLGEVALVGIDSPVYQSGLFFDEVLFDENAACHIAIGSAYRKCIEGGTELKEDELEANGVNESSVHQDIMISSENVSVSATCYDSRDVQIIKNGEWILDL